MQARAKANERCCMNLRNAGFADIENDAHFFHSEFLEVIKCENLTLLVIKFSDCVRQERSNFTTESYLKRIFFRPRGNRGDFFFSAAVLALIVKAAEIESA